MSLEQRTKKLRGSGGYVIASVNDDQQRKGNLGGPDLFLAAIGRLDEDTITKYYCNTCESNYDGSPKIQYENPNEEVSENLILVERGQYICSTCNSTIAEYRQFEKPDELNDAGLAKPTENIGTEASLESSTLLKPPSTIQETPQFDIPEQSDIKSPSIVNSIVGMLVFDEKGLRVGKAKQIGIDSTQKVVLVITKNDGSDITVPWNKVKQIGEIVLLGKQTDSQEQSKCSSCGLENKMNSKFCEECGNSL